VQRPLERYGASSTAMTFRAARGRWSLAYIPFFNPSSRTCHRADGARPNQLQQTDSQLGVSSSHRIQNPISSNYLLGKSSAGSSLRRSRRRPLKRCGRSVPACHHGPPTTELVEVLSPIRYRVVLHLMNHAQARHLNSGKNSCSHVPHSH
jgi:hypothetical protein